MKFIVAVDLEGVACAYAPIGCTISKAPNLDFVCKQATREADAAARALFDCGATEVIVWDNHGSGCSLLHDELDERCKISIGPICGRRYPILDETFAGVVLIGYHAKASTPGAAIAHTYSSVKYQHIKVNGAELGEVGIDSAIAGDKGVPVIFVAGDDKCIAEAREIMPWIEFTETKQSTSYTHVITKQPKAVVKEIYAGVKRAVNRLDEMKCFTVKTPLSVEIRYRRSDEACHAKHFDMEGNPFGFADAYTRTGMLRTAEDIVLRL